MGMTSQVVGPTLFEPHPNFSDVINRNIIQSEIEGGVHLRDLLPGTVPHARKGASKDIR